MGYSKKDEGGEIRWDDYRAFVTIAQTSSIKRAAGTLHTTQSALSKRLSRLEHSLGVRLVDRGPTGASLTYQGERVFARVLAADKELTRAALDARVAESRIEGDCSILMSDGIANYWFTHFVRQFFEWYPDIALKITLDHDIGAARNQIFDIRLHYYEPVDLAQIMRPLATVHFIPFASREYLQRFGTPSSPADMAQHRFVDQSQHLVGQGAWSSWSGDEILKHTALFTNQSAFLAKCVRAGVGIALVPTYMVMAYDNLVPLNIGATFAAKLYASYHRERIGTQPVKTTLSFLRNVVFDPKTMPWFEEEYRPPEIGWHDKFSRTVDIARPKSPLAAV